MDEGLKNAVDVAAVGVTVGTIVGLLPAVAAFFTALYMVIRIWESPTGRRILRAVCKSCADWWER